MSVIQNFKKRQNAKAAKNSQLPKTNTSTAMPNIKPNALLTLLAQLLQVPENVAVETAEKYIASNITFFADFANGQDETVTGFIETNDTGEIVKITNVEEPEAVKETITNDIANSASDIDQAASNIEQSAEQANDAASNLAYTADDINEATENLKEATAEIKKPRAPRKSSTSKKKPAPRKSSKK